MPLLLLCIFTLGLTACASQTKDVHTPLYQKKVNRSLSPHFQYLESGKQIIHEKQATPFKRRPIALIGTGKFLQAFDSASEHISEKLKEKLAKDAPGSVSLNFTNVPVREAAKAVLGEILGLNYSIDDDVSAILNFKTKKAIEAGELVAVFDALLSHHHLALSQKNSIFYITMQENALFNEPDHRTPLGSKHFKDKSIAPIALTYISASQIFQVLNPIVSEYAHLSIDRSRNILFVKANRENLQKVHDLVSIFDVDWMRGLSFAIYPLNNVSSKTLVKDLHKIFNTQKDGNLLQDLVEFIPLDRMNSLLVVSKNPRYLPRIAQWVEHLDQGQENSNGLYVYKLNYAKADQISEILKTIFNAGATVATTPEKSKTSDNNDSKKNQETSTTPLQRQNSPTQIHHDMRNNSLIIRATPGQYRTIEAAIKKLDVLPMQVMIEATIAEVTLTDSLSLGLNSFFGQQRKGGQVGFGLSGKPSKTSPSLTTTGNAFSFILSKANIGVALNALQSMTDLKVLSAPHIMVLNNESATLNSGLEIPIRTQGTSSITHEGVITTGVQYRKTGITLEVTPHITPTGIVNLDITQSISSNVSDDSSSQGGGGGSANGGTGDDTPTLSNQSVDTMVSVKSGQTIALGGLITEKNSKSNAGVPFLKNIPVLGALFSGRKSEADRTELLILITPHIIQNSEHADQIRDELQNKMMIATRFIDNTSAFYDKNYQAGTLQSGWATESHPTIAPVKFTHKGAPDLLKEPSPSAQFAEVSRPLNLSQNSPKKLMIPAVPTLQINTTTRQLSKPRPLKTPILVAQIPHITPGAGIHYVQLTAVSKPATAIESWHAMKAKHPVLFQKLSPIIREPAAGRKLYRLQTGPFSVGDASKLCSYLKQTNGACLVLK